MLKCMCKGRTNGSRDRKRKTKKCIFDTVESPKKRKKEKNIHEVVQRYKIMNSIKLILNAF